MYIIYITFILFYFIIIIFLASSRAAPVAHGGSQARGLIGAVATDLCYSHSNTGSEPRLRCTPQLRATTDPHPTEQGQGSNPQPHGSWLDSFQLHHDGNSYYIYFKESTYYYVITGFI